MGFLKFFSVQDSVNCMSFLRHTRFLDIDEQIHQFLVEDGFLEVLFSSKIAVKFFSFFTKVDLWICLFLLTSVSQNNLFFALIVRS